MQKKKIVRGQHTLTIFLLKEINDDWEGRGRLWLNILAFLSVYHD